MKLFRLAVAAVFAFAYGSAYAFHSGGVAECEGCHSMHNSFEGSANVTGMPQFQSGPFLLKAQDQSGACLNCHNSADAAPTGYHISTDASKVLPFTPAIQGPIEQTPGGDFAWLKTTRTGSIRKTLTTWDGDRQGHNIIAVDYGYTADKVQTKAPGGTYPAASLACSSCHDPHGKYRRFADGTIAKTGLPIFNSGSYTTSNQPIANVSAVGVYRLLAGVGYQPASLSGSFAFTNASPYALAAASYNAVNTAIAGNQPSSVQGAPGSDRVAYGFGMSEWCSNCHPSMHNDNVDPGVKGGRHPAGNGYKLTTEVVANYAAYVSSGIAGTPPANGFSALAPFELGTTANADMVSFSASPLAPDTTRNVMCLSCHRAHASGFESIARYYLGNEFMTIGDSTGVASYDTSTTENKINTAYSVAQQTNAYNGRPASLFGPYARDYCNKCHNKD